MARSRNDVHSGVPTIRKSSLLPEYEEDEDDGNDSSDSDRKSKMSFSYWGADKVTVHKPVIKGRGTATGTRKGTMTPMGFGRDSAANAKFGSRLVNQDGPHHNHNRPASRRTQATPSSRRAVTSEDGHSTAKSTVTSSRPAWDGSTRAINIVPGTKRPRNTSQTSNTVAPKTSNKSLASPAPSEDSGVGLYRQYIAQDPLNT